MQSEPHGHEAHARLVIADVDGTLVTPDKVLTPRAIKAVSALRAADVRFTITSGRPPKGMTMIIDPLRISEPVAAFNGGVVVNPDLTVISGRFLEPSVAGDVIQLIAKHGLAAWLYSEKEWYVRSVEAPHVAREQWTVKFPPVVVGDYSGHLERVAKIVGVSDD